jgi:hypothetical protein
MKCYKQQMLQALQPVDKVKQYEFWVQTQAAVDDDKSATRLIFSDEATFHLSGKVNHLNMHIQRLDNPCTTIQQQWDLPKLYVSCTNS